MGGAGLQSCTQRGGGAHQRLRGGCDLETCEGEVESSGRLRVIIIKRESRIEGSFFLLAAYPFKYIFLFLPIFFTVSLDSLSCSIVFSSRILLWVE